MGKYNMGKRALPPEELTACVGPARDIFVDG